MAGRVHIVGAGLAGLSAATGLTRSGIDVALYEAAAFAGGRCRTFEDPRLGCRVDNGNHLMLSGNHEALAYARAIGGDDFLRVSDSASFPFNDLETKTGWTLKLGDGLFPWWMMRAGQRVPDTAISDYVGGVRLAFARAGATVAGAIRGRGQLWHRFWRPLCWAVLNTTPERGAAALLWRAMSETFLRGGRHCRPVFAPEGLGTALIDPAIARLQQHGATLSFQHALRGVTTEGDRLSALHFTNGSVQELGKEDRVVLALPPSRLKAVLPWVDVPADDAGIVNVHFRIADPTIIADRPPMTGLVNATTHWIFIRGDVISLTISAADRLGPMTRDPEELLPELWRETCQALDLGDARYVAARVNKERRATFDQSPAEVARRPSARTALTNLFLAGDATDTGLPATIEGAVRSGNLAARLAA